MKNVTLALYLLFNTLKEIRFWLTTGIIERDCAETILDFGRLSLAGMGAR